MYSSCKENVKYIILLDGYTHDNFRVIKLFLKPTWNKKKKNIFKNTKDFYFLFIINMSYILSMIWDIDFKADMWN